MNLKEAFKKVIKDFKSNSLSKEKIEKILEDIEDKYATAYSEILSVKISKINKLWIYESSAPQGSGSLNVDKLSTLSGVNTRIVGSYGEYYKFNFSLKE